MCKFGRRKGGRAKTWPARPLATAMPLRYWRMLTMLWKSIHCPQTSGKMCLQQCPFTASEILQTDSLRSILALTCLSMCALQNRGNHQRHRQRHLSYHSCYTLSGPQGQLQRRFSLSEKFLCTNSCSHDSRLLRVKAWNLALLFAPHKRYGKAGNGNDWKRD